MRERRQHSMEEVVGRSKEVGPGNNPHVVIFVRHGQYEYGGGLSEVGIEETRSLAERLKNEFIPRDMQEPGDMIIIASAADRALETGKVLAEVIDAPVIQKDVLGDEDGKAYMASYIIEGLGDWIDSLVGSRVVIIVTHQDQTGYLPKEMDKKIRGRSGSLANSCAYVLYPNMERDEGVAPDLFVYHDKEA